MAKCIGCGITLQSIDKELPGYVPEHIILDEQDIYCKRCYDIMHHGIKYAPSITNKDYYQRIDRIKDEQAIVVLMIEALDIYGGFIPNLYKHIGSNKVIILVNKIDLLPKDIHLDKLEAKIKMIAASNNLNVVSLIMLSAKKKKNVERVLSKIVYLQEQHDYKTKNIYHKASKSLAKIYILGTASVGKSTFLNVIKKDYLHDDKLLTTSEQFQTTLDFIKIYIDKNTYLIDTPGFINYHSYKSYLNDKETDILNPKNYLKPKTYQLNSDQSIFLGGLVRLDFNSSDKINVSFYTSNDLYIHRTKRDKADGVYEKNLYTLLVPPLDQFTYDKIKNFKVVKYEHLDGIYDIVISGIGFIHIKGVDVSVDIKLFEAIDVNITESFI